MIKFCSALRLIVFIAGIFISTGSAAQFRQKYSGGNVNNDILGMSFLTPSTGFVAFTNFIGFTQDSGQTYIQRFITAGNTDFNGYSVNLTNGFLPRGVHAFTTDSLFAYGSYTAAPAILFSANQGVTWKLMNQRNPSTDIYNRIFDIAFPGNGNIGIAVHHLEVLRSTNRGQTWTPVLFTNKTERLSFPTSTTGYVIGGSNLYKSTNSGATWAVTNMPAGTNSGSDFNNVNFVNNSFGYITENLLNQVFTTSNGGVNWRKMNNENVIPINGSDLRFINDSTGFICKPFSYTVYKTSDSGKVWEPCKKNSNYSYLGYGFERLHFSNQYGWAGGAGEYLMIASPGIPVYPKAFFVIDTVNYYQARLVKMQNYSKPNYQHAWYINGVFISNSYNASYTHSYSTTIDTIKLVVTNGIDSDTSIQYQVFNPPAPSPVISSFSPTSGSGQADIIINGTNFTGVTNVSFGGVPAFYFTVVSNTQIQAVVGLTGASGSVSVTKPDAPTHSLAGFTFLSLPVITSFSPLSGNVGSTVIISGSNFSSIAANNTVYFGAVKAIVVNATPTSLSVTVPSGATYAPITVTVSTLTAISPRLFTVTFDNGAVILISQPSKLDIVTGTIPKNVAMVDFDGDGKPDLAVPNKTANTVYIYKNTSIGDSIKFATPLSINSGLSNPVRVIAADADGDGKQDIIVTNLIGINGNKITIHKNTSTPGSLSFSAALGFTTSSNFNYENPESIAIEDFDGNGKTDIAVANLFDTKISLHINKTSVANINFQRYDFFVGDKPTSVSMKDIDGDGKPDLIAGIYRQFSNGSLYIFRNLSNPAFNTISLAAAVDFNVPNSPMHISISDFDNDGKPDIVLSDSSVGKVFVYRNISVPGTITLDVPVELTAGTHTFGTAIGDINGDGKPDIAVTNRGANNVSVFKNTGSTGIISFASAINYSVANGPEGIVMGDLNSDKRPEIITANSLSNKLSVLYWPSVSNSLVCPVSTTATINGNITGAVFQWQQDTGTGYSDIFNNANYAGTSTNALQLSGINNNWDGYKFRCVADGINGQEFILRIRNTWTGAVNNAWENPANWSCNAIPDSLTNVVINSGNILISSAVVIRSLTLNTPAVCTVGAGYSLIVLH